MLCDVSFCLVWSEKIWSTHTSSGGIRDLFSLTTSIWPSPLNNIRTLIKVLDKVFVHNFVGVFLNTWHNWSERRFPEERSVLSILDHLQLKFSRWSNYFPNDPNAPAFKVDQGPSKPGPRIVASYQSQTGHNWSLLTDEVLHWRGRPARKYIM